MKTRNKLVYLKYYECPQVAIDFAKVEECASVHINIDHNSLILIIPKIGGNYYHEEFLARITYKGYQWYWSTEPRIECDQEPLISTANLARNYAIEHEDNVPSYYWLRVPYKMEEVYK